MIGLARVGHGLYVIIKPDLFSLETTDMPARAERGDGQPRPPRNFVDITVGVLLADLTPARAERAEDEE